MQPSPTPPASSSRAQIERKIKQVADRIVRGRHATDGWAVWFYQRHRIISVILSVLGTAGLASPQLFSKPTVESGWPAVGSWSFVGGLLALIGAIALQLYNEFGVQKIAIQSLSAKQSYSLVETNLHISLGNEDPIKQLNALLEEANTLWRNFNEVMSKPPPELDKEATDLTNDMLRQYQEHWQLPASDERRRPRK